MSARLQLAILGATALTVVAFAAVQSHMDRSVFEQYLGTTNPVIVMLGVSALAFISLSYLRRRGFCEIVSGEGSLAGFRFAVIVAPLFAGAAIVADLLLRYPNDLNVAAPDALFFYPAIGFLVEVCFHVVPLALLIALFARHGIVSERTFWSMAFPVVMLEVVLQVANATTVRTAWFSGLQLLAFGLVQLHVFRRFGFMWMYTFRLVFYSLWHIVWGYLRLDWLF